jgi:hypothetical protein
MTVNPGPILIGGAPYSGKTPMRLLLSALPDVAFTRRTYMWPRFYGRYGDLARPRNLERCLNAMMQEKTIQALAPDRQRIRREFLAGPAAYGRLFGLFHAHHAERMGKSRWGDQLAFVEHYADAIFEAFPTAKMIHMVRDPRARHETARTRTRHRKGKAGWDIARWLHSVHLAFRNRERYPGHYKIVRYESLLAHPEETMQSICAFLAEDFDPALIPTEIVTEREHERSQESSGQARRHPRKVASGLPLRVPMREIAFTQMYAERAMLDLGYAPGRTQLSLRERVLFYCVDWPLNRAGMAAWRIRKAGPYS